MLTGLIGTSYLNNLFCLSVLQLDKGTNFRKSVAQVLIFLCSFCICVKIHAVVILSWILLLNFMLTYNMQLETLWEKNLLYIHNTHQTNLFVKTPNCKQNTLGRLDMAKSSCVIPEFKLSGYSVL